MLVAILFSAPTLRSNPIHFSAPTYAEDERDRIGNAIGLYVEHRNLNLDVVDVAKQKQSKSK